MKSQNIKTFIVAEINAIMTESNDSRLKERLKTIKFLLSLKDVDIHEYSKDVDILLSDI